MADRHDHRRNPATAPAAPAPPRNAPHWGAPEAKPQSRAFWVRCLSPDCQTFWPLFYYPCRLADIAKIAETLCPKCGRNHTLSETRTAYQNNGILMETALS